ncbi:MAG TPA: type II toxin-antitoxin system RelE/ParE family toxin [Bryobacteraceae bacterium]
MSRYVLTVEAQDDFRVARYVIASLVAEFRAIARTPGQGHRRDDLTERIELRFRSVFSYLIVYRIDNKPLIIVAILHGKRDVRQLLKER